MEQPRLKTNCANVFYEEIDDNDKCYYILVENRKKIITQVIGKASENISPKEAYQRYEEKIKFSKRNHTRYPNVFWRYCKTNGKDDKTFYVRYRDKSNKACEEKIGKASENITLQYAYQKQIEIKNKINQGEVVEKKSKRRKIFTFYAAFVLYMEHTQDNKITWKKDQELFNNHLNELHGRELVSLTQYDFNKIKTEKSKSYSQSTVKYILGVARQIINYAINHELVKNYSNPIAKGRVHMKQPANEKLAFLQKEEASLLLKELKQNHSQIIYDLTVMLLFTGARFSEVASLTWKDVDFKTNLIYFKATKNGNSRHVAMTDKVIEVILSHQDNGNFLIFPSQNEKQMIQMPRQWQDIVDELFKGNKPTTTRKEGQIMTLEQKLEREKQQKYRITVHSLRHTHASWMAMSNKFTLMEIQKQLGHKTIQMTQRYAHLMANQIHEKHNDVFGGF